MVMARSPKNERQMVNYAHKDLVIPFVVLILYRTKAPQGTQGQEEERKACETRSKTQR